MAKESKFLIAMSILTTLGLCVAVNLAYFIWWKPAIVEEEGLFTQEEKKSSSYEEQKNSSRSARHSYAS